MSKDYYPSIFLISDGSFLLKIHVHVEAIRSLLSLIFATKVVLKIGEYINNSFHLAWKQARISVHHLFQEANSFLRA